jgi:hypothetical protein
VPTAGLPNSGERAVASVPIASWDAVAEQTLRMYPALMAQKGYCGLTKGP